MLHTNRNPARRGLAPLELVLWLPLLMFVAALMVNMGTMTTWRIRGEIVARDAVWRTRTPRTGASETRPADANWPVAAKMASGGDQQIDNLDLDRVRHEVVRGPHPSPNYQAVDVRETLIPDQGAKRGVSAIERDYPLLAKLGPFRSGDIRHPLLDNKFQITEMRVPKSELSLHETETPPNIFRRIKIIYHLTETDPSYPMAFRDAVLDLLGMPCHDNLNVLDRDEEIRRYTGGYHDFHPHVGYMCELDPEIVQEVQVDRLIDILLPDGKVRLGQISYLPRRMTNYFLSMYRGATQRLEDQIQQMKSSGGNASGIASAQAEINQMKPKIKQLEDFLQKLPEFEEQMRAERAGALAQEEADDDRDRDDEQEFEDEFDEEDDFDFDDDNDSEDAQEDEEDRDEDSENDSEDDLDAEDE